MSLHNKPASVLTHGGASDEALASTISTRALHHAKEVEAGHLDAGVTEHEMAKNFHMNYGERPTPTHDIVAAEKAEAAAVEAELVAAEEAE